MPEAVKGEVGRRARKAQETRRRILAAAERLFGRDGFAATTMAAIAEEADVAGQTVYAVFGTKRAILTELLAVRTVGEDDAIPLPKHPDWEAMEQEPDPVRRVQRFAAIATQIGARMAPLYVVMAGAGDADPEIAELFRRQQELRHKDQRRVVRTLARDGALRADLTETRATDAVWAVANPRTYHSLVNERRWPAAEYERWLADTLLHVLLGHEPPT